MLVGRKQSKARLIPVAIIGFFLATSAHAQYHQECWNQYYACTSPCYVNIGIRGTNWFDGCVADCKAKQRACDEAANQNTTPPPPPPPPSPSAADLLLQQQQEAERQRRDQIIGKVNGLADRWNAAVDAGTLDEAEAQRILEEFQAWRRGLSGSLDFMILQDGKQLTLTQWLDNNENFYSSSLADIRRQLQEQKVPEPADQSTPSPQPRPQPQPKATKRAPARRELSDQQIEALIRFYFGALGYDADDFAKVPDRLRAWVQAAIDQVAAAKKAKALQTRKAADEAFTQAARDGSILNGDRREEIRKMYLDSWFDDPKDKQTSMMMAIFEKEAGNLSTARTYEGIAYMNLSQSERNTFSAAVNKARESMSERLMREDVKRTQMKNQLENSRFMNQLNQNVADSINEGQQASADACRAVSVCDWAWMKKVAVMTEAEKLSAEVKRIMNDPLKTVFGIDKESAEKTVHGK